MPHHRLVASSLDYTRGVEMGLKILETTNMDEKNHANGR